MSYPARGPASAGIDGKAIAACRRRANLRVTTMLSRGGRTDPAPAHPPPPLSRRAGTQCAAAPLRLTALARQPPAPLPDAARVPLVPERSPAHYLWALLLARIYEILPLRCALCGGEMRLIAFVTDEPAIHSILTYLGEPSAAPEVAPARGPPLWEQAAQSHWDDTPAPAPEYVFDQRVSW